MKKIVRITEVKRFEDDRIWESVHIGESNEKVITAAVKKHFGRNVSYIVYYHNSEFAENCYAHYEIVKKQKVIKSNVKIRVCTM